MQMIPVAELKPHPQNEYFFDDIQGEAWQEFLKSIQTSGVIEPVVITQDKIIVSGHQRVRACKELGIPEVMTEMRSYELEDEVLKQLIESNIRQRNPSTGSATKWGRIITELKRIYGIKNGNNQFTNRWGQAGPPRTREDLAEELGMSVATLRRLEKLSKLIPEMSEFLDDGTISKEIATSMVSKLSKDEQNELVDIIRKNLGKKKRLTKEEVQSYIDNMNEMHQKIYNMSEQIRGLQDEKDALQDENVALKKENESLKNKPPEVVTKVVTQEVVKEVAPSDYESLKKQAKAATKLKKDYEAMSKKYEESEKEKQSLLEDRKDPGREATEHLRKSMSSFCIGVRDFISNYGGYSWLTDKLNSMSDSDKEEFLSAISAMESLMEKLKNSSKGI